MQLKEETMQNMSTDIKAETMAIHIRSTLCFTRRSKVHVLPLMVVVSLWLQVDRADGLSKDWVRLKQAMGVNFLSRTLLSISRTPTSIPNYQVNFQKMPSLLLSSAVNSRTLTTRKAPLVTWSAPATTLSTNSELLKRVFDWLQTKYQESTFKNQDQ